MSHRSADARGVLWISLLSALALTAPLQASDDLMSMSLEELMQMDVGVASRVSRSLARQPVSVTTIQREQIQLSGARTLNELLMLHVPGFFLVEDQDDTIAAVRGLAPDNNSKLMLLLDGKNLNAEWFWGPPDALLNALDLDFIERVEVIRGPGSVTQGQGALLGVVNLVTRSDRKPGHLLSAHQGSHGRQGLSWSWQWQADAASDRRAALYLSKGELEGQPYRNEGLGQQFEQGLTVFERNHRLKRSDYQHLLGRWSDRNWSLDAFRFDQLRDLYNWRRDREQVRQVLSGLSLQHRRDLGAGALELDAHHHVDDYLLQSHGGTRPEAARSLIPGLIMGGHRETRSGLRAVWKADAWRGRHRLVVGAEVQRYRSGQRDRRGNNFIVNSQDEVLERGLSALNANNRWALPGSLMIHSLFVEDFIEINDRLELFAAARFDSHPDWGSELSPRVGLFWQQNARHTFRLSWQSGFRGAVGVHYSGGFEGDGLLSEANFGAVEANPFFAQNGNRNLAAVRPEKLSSRELSWTYDDQQALRLSAVAYYNVARNVIGVGAYFLGDDELRAQAVAEASRIGTDRIGDWGGVFYFQNNPGALTHRGLELEAEYRLPQLGMVLRGSQSIVKVGSADPGQFGPGNIYVSGSPERPGSRSFPENVSRLQWTWQDPDGVGPWRLMYSHLYYSSWQPPSEGPAGQQAAGKLKGNQIGNLGLQFHPTNSRSTLSLSLKNLWNAGRLYPATSVAGEGEGNQGVPGLERRTVWLTWRYRLD